MITTIFVGDVDRAVRFYTDVLGCKLEMRFGNEWAQLKSDDGGAVLGLHPASNENPAGVAGSIQLGIQVPDGIHERVAEMTAKGAKFDGPVRDDGQILFANFKDPDGNRLYLAQAKEKWS
jgi:catechol 2,3-dioxygenase-like lactoylglutathione lyase family enzyme